MCMRLENVGSQYLATYLDTNGNGFDGAKTYKATLPPNIPAARFWSFTVYDNQTRSMLDTPQRYPRAGSRVIRHPLPNQTPMLPRRCTLVLRSPTGSSEATGSRRCLEGDGSRSFASTARSKRSSTRAGAQAKSNWSSNLGRDSDDVAGNRLSRHRRARDSIVAPCLTPTGSSGLESTRRSSARWSPRQSASRSFGEVWPKANGSSSGNRPRWRER